MKKKTLIIGLFVLTLSFFAITMRGKAASLVYKASGVADSTSIELSTSILNNAKSNCIKKTTSFKQYGYINEAYQVHIYHFEAQSSGYFAFYTTGSSDSLIKVYEHQNFLWWTTRYKDLGKVDDTSTADKNRLNAGFVLNCDAGEDYYICVRLYNKSIGSYTLNVEPNEDKLLRSTYKKSYWECEYLSAGTANAGCWVSNKQYLTAEETILFYWSLDPACQELVGKDFNYLYNAYNQGVQNGIDAANLILGILLSISGADPITSVSTSVLGTILSYTYSATEKTAYEMMQTLANDCGVKYNGSTWTSKHGLVIKEFYTGTVLGSKYYYDVYDNDVLVGDSYEKGKWVN